MVLAVIVAAAVWWTQRATINKTDEISELQEEREKEKDALAALQLATVQQETEVLKGENLRLEAAIAPRRLGNKQQIALASLAAFANRVVEVKSYSSDTEGLLLATQIADSLAKSHIAIWDNRLTMQPAGEIKFGVFVSGTNKELVDALKSILGNFASPASLNIHRNVGFSVSVNLGNVTPVNPPAAVIVVGPKPIK